MGNAVMATSIILDKGNITIENYHTKKFIISMKKEQGETSLKLLDENGIVLMHKSYYGKFKKVINLMQLEYGEYQLVIDNREQKIIQPLLLSNDIFLKDQATKIHPYPKLRVGNEYIFVNLDQIKGFDDYQVIISDLDGENRVSYALYADKAYRFNIEQTKGVRDLEVILMVDGKIIDRSIIFQRN